jgi:hypothetical protein
MGNSIGSPLYGTTESLGHVTKSDVDALLNTIHGGDVVVVATGNNNGSGASHDKLVEDVSKAYGNLPSSAKASAAGSVVKAEDKSGYPVRVSSFVALLDFVRCFFNMSIIHIYSLFSQTLFMPLALFSCIIIEFDMTQ